MTTNGKRKASGICDLRDGTVLRGVKAPNGEAGGEAAERRVAALIGAAFLDGGVLTVFGVGVSSTTDCDLARLRAIAAVNNCQENISSRSTEEKWAVSAS